MKLLFPVTFAILASVSLVTASDVPPFPGFEKAMSPEAYQKAGLGKLTDSERSALDRFVRDYVAAKQKDAATVAAAEAVERAVKERRVKSPEVIESRIVGVYRGVGLRTVFRLENGELWKPTNSEVAPAPPINNPAVAIYRDMFGYKMFIEGASIIRVKRVE